MFGPRHDPGTSYFVPRADSGATQQIWNLYRSGNPADARLIQKMVTTPQAVWITSGTPKDVTKQVRATMRAAKATRTVPVLVAYDLPYRDCAQYSAGGATDTAAYQAWIDAFAAGIGDGQAVVLLEPDSLGIIPFYGQFGSSTLEWCQPTVTAADGTTSPAPEADLAGPGGRPGAPVRAAEPRGGRPQGPAQDGGLPGRDAQPMAGLR